MKKYLKLFICMLTLVIGCGMAVFNPAINCVNAIESFTGSVIANTKGDFGFKAVKMPSNINAEEDTEKTAFFIPIPAVTDASDNATVKINVKKGKTSYVYMVGAAENPACFVATIVNGVQGVQFKYTSNSTYEVYFTAERDSKIYSSSIYDVTVSGVAYTFDLANASKIPANAGIGDRLEVPTLAVLDAQEEAIDGATITTQIMKNGKALVKGTEGEYYTRDGKDYFIPQSEATYTIRYTADAYNLRKDYSITVSADFDSSKVELSAATLTMSTVELNKEVTFPKAVVTDKHHNLSNVATTTTITVVDKDHHEVELDADKYAYTFTKPGSYTVKYHISNFYLDHIKSIDVQISEEVVVRDSLAPTVNFAKNYTTAGTDWEDNVEVLGDYAVPTKVGYNGITFPALYATDVATAYADMTFQRVLKSNAGTEYDIDSKDDNASLDADYVKDITKSVAFSFKREAEETDEDYIARVKGTYTLIYRATEEVVSVEGADPTKRTASNSVSIQIMGVDAVNYTDDTNLEITLPTIATEMKSDDIKTVTVTKATDDNDTSIETHYYIYYGTKSAINDAFDDAKIAEKDYAYNFETFKTTFVATNPLYELTCKDNKLIIELENYTDATNFTVVAVAINDQGQFVIDTTDVKVKNATTDDEAPSISVVSTGFDKTTYKLGEDTKVELPSITFADDVDDHCAISVKYYIDNPSNGMKPINGAIFSYNEGEKKVTVSGGYINPTQAGDYYVVYTIKDDANNVEDYVTSFKVEKVTTYHIDIDYTNEIYVYGSTEINVKVLDDDNNEVTANTELIFNGLTPTREGSNYTFDCAGDYYFDVKAKIGGDVVAELTNLHINVKEAEYTWVNKSAIYVPNCEELSPSTEYSLLTAEPSDWTTATEDYYTNEEGTETYNHVTGTPDFETDTYYKKNELKYVQFAVPQVKLKYNDNGKTYDATVTVKNPSGEEVELIEEDGYMKFLAEKEGKYSVVFSYGAGNNALTTGSEYYAQVGDNNKPVVKINNKTKLQEDIVYSNKDITYKLTYVRNTSESTAEVNIYDVTVKATVGSDTISSYTVKVSLYDIDGSNNKKALKWENAINNSAIKLNNKASESTSEYRWTISSVGSYTLTINATDSHSVVSNPETVTFKVVDKASAKEEKDNKVGIVLIIVSIVILVGIVCFFAFSGKKFTSKNKKAKKAKAKEETTEKEDK